jgi:ABC-type lipoprotein release transport system permease subunit
MTVMTGLVSDFKDKNHRYVGDCVVGTESLVGFAYYDDFAEILKREDFVEGVSPVIKSYGLVGAAGAERSIGVEIVGIEPAMHSRVTGFGKSLHYHRADAASAFVPDYDANHIGCVIGIDLWLRRHTNGDYDYGERPAAFSLAVTCFPLTVKGALARAGTDLVNTRTFYFSDTSESGLARVDGSVVYLPFEEVQSLCGMKGPVARASWIHIKFKSNISEEEGYRKVSDLWRKFSDDKKGEKYADLLKTVSVQGWRQNRREYIAAMEKEQTMMTAMFGLVGLTTVFIIFVVFYMIVSHKSKDIGILKSLGVSAWNLISLFLLFSFLLGLIGSAVGAASGWVFLRYINRIEGWLFEHFGFQLWDRTMYAIGDIPNEVKTGTITVIVACAILACLAGAVLPSRRAVKATAAEALQVSQI